MDKILVEVKQRVVFSFDRNLVITQATVSASPKISLAELAAHQIFVAIPGSRLFQGE